jgi:hypothetical protein
MHRASSESRAIERALGDDRVEGGELRLERPDAIERSLDGGDRRRFSIPNLLCELFSRHLACPPQALAKAIIRSRAAL